MQGKGKIVSLQLDQGYGGLRVRATVYGNLAIHKHGLVHRRWRPEDGYTVTHVPSGLTVAKRINSVLDAVAITLELLKVDDWSFAADDLKQDPDKKVYLAGVRDRAVIEAREGLLGLSHEDRKAQLDARINSVLAEVNNNLPIYRPT